MECYLNPFEPYFEHSSKWTNLVFQLRISPPAEKRYWLCGKIPTVFGFAVIISTVGSHQVRVCFINSSRLSLASVAWMKPLRIQYNRCFTCHKFIFCQHASKSMDARRKTLNCTKANWNAFYTCGSLAVSRSQSEFLIKRHSVQRSGAGRMCQRRKSIDFDNMWQLRIWYLDIDGLRAWRQILNCTKATRNAFYICGSLAVSRSQSDFLAKKTLRCEKVELGELSPCSKPSKQWEFLRLR